MWEDHSMAKSKPALTPDEIELLRAARDGDLHKIQDLVAQGVNVNVKSKDFAPPLAGLIAAATNTTSMVLHNGKLVPAAQKLWEQKDALLDTIKALLAAGANPDGS